MLPVDRDLISLLDILQAAQNARSFVQNQTYEVFLQSLKDQSAVIWQIATMGEAVRRISAEFRNAHPEVPWQDIAGMRSKLIHDYDQIDLQEVWNVLQIDLVELIALLQPLIPPESPTPSK
jgi:uncharacterized protein with HEPN domain